MVLNKLKGLLLRTVGFFKIGWKFNMYTVDELEVSLGLKDIITSQNSVINEFKKDIVELYNQAVSQIHGRMYKFEMFNNSAYPFYDGRLAIKSKVKVKSYAESDKFDEVPITFEGHDSTYYWYFYKIGNWLEEVEE